MDDTIALVEKSFQEAQDFGNAFTSAVLKSFIQKCPDAQTFFNQVNAGVQDELMMRLFAVIINNLRTPQQLRQSLHRFSQNELGMFFADRIPMLKCGDALIETVSIFLAEQWTPNLHAAWVMAFNHVYQVLEVDNAM